MTRIEPALSTVPHAGGVLSVAEIRLGGTPRGTVVVLTDSSVLGYAVVDVLNRLAEHGYCALAAEIGPPDGLGVTDAVAALLDRVRAAGVPDAQLGVVGYGEGASTALAVAFDTEVGAAVGVAASPGPLPVGVDTRSLKSPWLGLYARAGEYGGALRALLDRQAVYSRLVLYPGATPAFHRSDGPAADHAVAFDSWQRTIEWLNLRVEPCLTPFARSWASRERARPRSPRTRRNGD